MNHYNYTMIGEQPVNNGGGIPAFLNSSFYDYINKYSSSIILFALSVVAFYACMSGKKKKKLDGTFAFLMIILPISAMLQPSAEIARNISQNAFATAIKGSSDEVFNAVVDLSASVIPAISGFLLLLCGVVLCGRLLTDNFSAEVPKVKKVAVMSESGNEKQENFAETDVETSKSETAKVPEFKSEVLPHSNDKSSDMSIISDSNKAEPVMAAVEMPKTDDEKIGEAKYCPSCHAKLKDGAKFCQSCGAQLN